MYDSHEELLAKVRLGEDTTLELKEIRFKGDRVADPKRDDLADEIAAIANTRDGVLILGVDDKTREILGVSVEHLEAVERFVYEICNQSIQPPVLFQSVRMELSDVTGTSRAIQKIDVPRSLYVHESPGGYFHRQGSSKRRMPPDVLARLFQQRSQARLIRFDEQPVPGARFSDLAEPLWRRFVRGALDEGESMLRKMKILTEADSGQVHPSVAGILACATEPSVWLPGAFIMAVRYRGNRPDSNYQIDAQDITGPVDRQVSEALAFVRRNSRVAAEKRPGRVEKQEYSMRAVFEAVVNAVAHRDYSVHGSKIRLFLFDDRLELYSPGTLPNTVSVESIALRQSTRNELLTTLLAKCPVSTGEQGDLERHFLMEKRGEGVPIIIEETRRIAGATPEYRVIDDSEVLLTIPAARLDDEDFPDGAAQN